MVSGSWPKAETLSQCFTLVRWFHEHGAPWSGTPAELAFTIATAGEGTSWFRNSDDLIKFIETNADMIRDLGVEASVRHEAGRTTIEFKTSSSEGHAAPPTAAAEWATQLQAIKAGLEQPEPVAAAAPQPEVVPQRPAVDFGARLHDLIDEDANKVTPYEAVKVEAPAPREAKKVDAPIQQSVRKGNSVGVSIGAAIILVLAIVSVVWWRNRPAPAPQATVAQVQPIVEKPEEKPTPVPTQTAPPPAAVPAPQPAATPEASTVSPAERQKFDATLAAATSGKLSAPQYDLAMRYAEGAGVAKDNAEAFAWLNIAEANGSTEATSALQVVQAKLSQDELQRARIAVAKAYTAGAVVNKNFVQAYRFLMKAEHDGSPEAAVLKKELETRMFAWQIIQAGGTPPSPEKKKD